MASNDLKIILVYKVKGDIVVSCSRQRENLSAGNGLGNATFDFQTNVLSVAVHDVINLGKAASRVSSVWSLF